MLEEVSGEVHWSDVVERLTPASQESIDAGSCSDIRENLMSSRNDAVGNNRVAAFEKHPNGSAELNSRYVDFCYPNGVISHFPFSHSSAPLARLSKMGATSIRFNARRRTVHEFDAAFWRSGTQACLVQT